MVSKTDYEIYIEEQEKGFNRRRNRIANMLMIIGGLMMAYGLYRIMF